jgi:hypothetical protein
MYCFIKEDLEILESHNPLLIQAEYAKHIDQFVYCSILEEKIYDFDNLKNMHNDEPVFLRTTCDSLNQTIKFFNENGIRIVENIRDIQAIENWDKYNFSSRKIFSVFCKDIIRGHFNKDVKEFLYANTIIFIKSRKKGFTAKVSTKRLLDKDCEFIKFLSAYMLKNEEVIISEYLDIVIDSLGKRESRHFVMNGQIMNSSRPIHSIRHNVPKSQIDYALSLVKKINSCLEFPANFVLDIGEFKKDDFQFIDIVEFNPITCSQCYINNSIFEFASRDILPFYNKTCMGYEYCLDALRFPEYYPKERLALANYEYNNVTHYEFL